MKSGGESKDVFTLSIITISVKSFPGQHRFEKEEDNGEGVWRKGMLLLLLLLAVSSPMKNDD